MKYIKFFENFDLGFKKVVYPRVANDERFIAKRTKIFNNDEIKEISDLHGKYGVKELNTDSLVNRIGIRIPYKDIKSTDKYISIEKYKDEWYLVNDHPFYYECDQMSGLIEFLKSVLPK